MGLLNNDKSSWNLTSSGELKKQSTSRQTAVLLSSTLVLVFVLAAFGVERPSSSSFHSERNLREGFAICATLDTKVGPPADFGARTVSDRFEEGTRAVWIRNATIWTGNDGFKEIIEGGELLLDGGIIKMVGKDLVLPKSLLDYEEVNVNGSWVTPGLVELHNHAGIWTDPSYDGTQDLSSPKIEIGPFLRALDGVKNANPAFELITAGGSTTSLVLPGSANPIGGQAWAFKLRPTKENSVMAMQLEPPFEIDENGDWTRTNNVRYSKHALGENPMRTWGQSRMDNIYHMREIYEEARLHKLAQDAWCSHALSVYRSSRYWWRPMWWLNLVRRPTIDAYPLSPLRLEAVVEVLRGKVLVNVHAYTGTDFDALVRFTREFGFHVSAVHHAHKAHLVPELLKKMWGGPPGAAIFATLGRYKHEAYKHSVHAAKILHDAGIPVSMHSDGPGAINPRYLLHEAVQAHYYGLEPNVAMQSVTTTPARLMGKDHRIGYLRKGYDADVVIWQSHPLQLGSTPAQVFVDGLPQISSPALRPREQTDQVCPDAPEWEEDRRDVVRTQGQPRLGPKATLRDVVLRNVSSVVLRKEGELEEFCSGGKCARVVVKSGEVVCVGECEEFVSGEEREIDLKGGSVAPGLTTIGSTIGQTEMITEPSTADEGAGEYAAGRLPTGDVMRASDALMFGTDEMLVDLRTGVTKALGWPSNNDPFLKGYAAFFSLTVQPSKRTTWSGAVRTPIAALALMVGHDTGTAVSVQMALLRRVLRDKEGTFGDVVKGTLPIVVQVHSADLMATILDIKADAEALHETSIRFVFFGASEAYLIASDLARAGVGVVLGSGRNYPFSWDMRRALPGPPLSDETALSILYKAGVTVAVAYLEGRAFTSLVAQSRWELAFTITDNPSLRLTTLEALAFGTTNLERMFGLRVAHEARDWVATEYGGLLEVGKSKIVAIGTGMEEGEVLVY